jgi:hypothetical protein
MFTIYENKISHRWRGCALLDSQLSSKDSQLSLVQEPAVVHRLGLSSCFPEDEQADQIDKKGGSHASRGGDAQTRKQLEAEGRCMGVKSS